MIVGIFRNRLRPDARGYAELAERMEKLATGMPGFLELKTFEAPDGERVTLFAFESEEHLAAWRSHPEHLKAQRRGLREIYSEYRLLVAEPAREVWFRDGVRRSSEDPAGDG